MTAALNPANPVSAGKFKRQRIGGAGKALLAPEQGGRIKNAGSGGCKQLLTPAD